MNGKIKGKQIEYSTVELFINNSPLDLVSYTVSSTGNGKQIINKEFLDTELDLKLDDSQLNDSAATSSTNSLWSVNKIYTEISGLSASLNTNIDSLINDAVTATDSTWSSDKIDTELDSKVDDSQIDDGGIGTTSLWSVDRLITEFELKLDDTQLNDSIIASTGLWSSDKISGELGSLNTSLDNLINDTVTATDSTWSSDKIDSEFDLKLDDTQLNDGAATSSTNNLWSVNKIYTELEEKLDKYLTQSYIFVGDDTNVATAQETHKLYEENVGNVLLTQEYLSLNYDQLELGQKIESTYQVGEKTLSGWAISKKNENYRIEVVLDVLDTDIFATSSLDLSSHLGADIYTLDAITTSNISITVSYIEGLEEKYNIELRVSDNLTANFIGATGTYGVDEIKLLENQTIRTLNRDTQDNLFIRRNGIYNEEYDWSIDNILFNLAGTVSASLLKDNIIATDSTWSSDKIDTELDLKLDDSQLDDGGTGTTSLWSVDRLITEFDLKLDDSQLDDNSATGSTANIWSVNKIYTEINNVINDSATATDSTWSSDKIDSELDLKLDDSQLDDGSIGPNFLWSSEQIEIELDLKLDDSQLNDSVIGTDSMWSSDKINTEIIGLSSSLNTDIDNLIDDTLTATDSTWSSDKIEDEISGLSSSIINIIDDTITATDSTWSSDKIDSELDIKLDDSQLNDSAATSSTNSLWSVNKINTEISGLSASLNIEIDNLIDDTVTATDSTWSSDKIDTELDLKLDDSQLDDTAIATDSMWSSDKINTELISLSSSIVSIIDDNITATDSTWSSDKIDTELDLKLDDSQLDDNSATGSTANIWSVNKIYTELETKLDNALTESYIFVGDNNNIPTPTQTYKLYEDNGGSLLLTEAYLYSNYPSLELGQKIESSRQVSEKTTSGWMISKKDHNQNIISSIDMLDPNIYSTSSQTLYLNDFLGTDIYMLDAVTTSSNLSFTVSYISGLVEDFEAELKVSDKVNVDVIGTTFSSPNLNEILLYNNNTLKKLFDPINDSLYLRKKSVYTYEYNTQQSAYRPIGNTITSDTLLSDLTSHRFYDVDASSGTFSIDIDDSGTYFPIGSELEFSPSDLTFPVTFTSSVNTLQSANNFLEMDVVYGATVIKKLGTNIWRLIGNLT